MVGACNAINGAGDIGFADGTGAGGNGTGNGDGGGRTDGGSNGEGGGAGDGSSDPDGGGGPVVIPNPTLAPCGNKQLCLPNANGWTPALLQLGSLGGGCPSEWPTKTTYQQSGGGDCACSCSPAGGSCAGTVDTKSGPACGGVPTNLAVSSTTACTDLAATLPVPVSVTAHPNSASAPTSCGGTADPQLRGPQPAVVCSGATPVAGAQCNPGEICVPRNSSFPGGFTCIVHDGEVACPSKLMLRTIVAASLTDGRSCGAACTCEPVGCAGGTLEAFTNAGCTASIRKVNVDGTCITGGAALTGASYRYTTPSGCGVKQRPVVLGNETYTSPRTLCCSFGL